MKAAGFEGRVVRLAREARSKASSNWKNLSQKCNLAGMIRMALVAC